MHYSCLSPAATLNKKYNKKHCNCNCPATYHKFSSEYRVALSDNTSCYQYLLHLEHAVRNRIGSGFHLPVFPDTDLECGSEPSKSKMSSRESTLHEKTCFEILDVFGGLKAFSEAVNFLQRVKAQIKITERFFIPKIWMLYLIMNMPSYPDRLHCQNCGKKGKKTEIKQSMH